MREGVLGVRGGIGVGGGMDMVGMGWGEIESVIRSYKLWGLLGWDWVEGMMDGREDNRRD